MFLPMIAGAGLGAGLSAGGVLGATSAAAVGLGTMATLSAGLSSYQQGKANSDIAKQQALEKQAAYNQNESLQRRRISQLLSAQRAASAASGITFEGSPLLTSLDTAYQFQLDSNIRKFNSDIGVNQSLNEAELSMLYGRSQLINSLFSAGANAFDTIEKSGK